MGATQATSKTDESQVLEPVEDLEFEQEPRPSSPDDLDVQAEQTEQVEQAEIVEPAEQGEASTPTRVKIDSGRVLKHRKIQVNPKTGLPVRPPTSFGLYKHALRHEFGDNKVSFQEFNKLAVDNWKKLSHEEKEPFIARSKELSERFKKIETPRLRKKVRQLQNQLKEYRRHARALTIQSRRS